MSQRNPIGEIMRKFRVLIIMGSCLFAMSLFASAQAAIKPGLWEMTANMTWQKSPLPPGITLPPSIKSPFSGTTTTTQVCLTQAMIDKYGAPVSQDPNCQFTNVMMKANSMTSVMVCSGKMNGMGTVESSWTDGNHANGKVHFSGTMQSGPNATPVEWTGISTSTYKGPDCGSVKPLPMPQN